MTFRCEKEWNRSVTLPVNPSGSVDLLFLFLGFGVCGYLSKFEGSVLEGLDGVQLVFEI